MGVDSGEEGALLPVGLEGMDIYLFDQLQKGRLQPGMRVLDAGCGNGRNLWYFLHNGFEVYAADHWDERLNAVKAEARSVVPDIPEDRFQQDDLAALSYPAAHFDFIICSAVLHFARDEDHFEAMVRNLWRLLKPGGICFTRLASSIGLEKRIVPREGRWYWLPDGSERFLVDEAYLLATTEALPATLADPIKTVNVQGLRCMTNWVWGKAPTDQ